MVSPPPPRRGILRGVSDTPDLATARRFVLVDRPRPGQAWFLLPDGSVYYQGATDTPPRPDTVFTSRDLEHSDILTEVADT